MEAHDSFEPRQFAVDFQKLTAAVIHLIEGSRSDPNFGETKLVKLLYYADCASFWRCGKPITGNTYVHYQFGPYPLDWYQYKAEMQRSGAVSVEKEVVYGVYPRHRWDALKAGEVEALEPEERGILDEQLRRFVHFNASAIVEYSHQELAWLATEEGQPLAYEDSGFAVRPLSAEDREKGKIVRDDIPW